MTSTEFNIGLSGAKSSSRVLKPPGGGHSNIFGEAEAKQINPRPKYDQQNSSNLNFCMNTTDPNKKVEGIKSGSANGAPAPVAQPSAAPEPAVVQPSAPVEAKPRVQQSTPAPEPQHAPAPAAAAAAATPAPAAKAQAPQPAAAQPAPAPQGGRSRVPPGGFSSGLW